MPKPTYPAAHRLDLVEKLPAAMPTFDIADPYRWLEDPATADSTTWLQAQDALATAHHLFFTSGTASFTVPAGVTQVEPGHGLTGTTPLHAVRDEPELPAALYVSEISHHHGGRAYCYGGGLYVDPVFPPYQVQALVSRDGDLAAATRVDADLPPPAAIDYYGMLHQPPGVRLAAGSSAVFGFRIQAFHTRAPVVALAGVAAGDAHGRAHQPASVLRPGWIRRPTVGV